MRIALFQPDIPQNVGAAIRAAACFQSDVDVIQPCGFPLDAREIRRVAMDYGALAPPTPHDDWAGFLGSIQSSDRLILMTTHSATELWDHRFVESDVILFGRESEGAPDFVHKRADIRLRIPIDTRARSLNLATAAAVTLAEARRQTRRDND